jgi:hypothetical protein
MKNAKRQNAERQNVEQQNVEQQNVETQHRKKMWQHLLVEIETSLKPSFVPRPIFAGRKNVSRFSRLDGKCHKMANDKCHKMAKDKCHKMTNATK